MFSYHWCNKRNFPETPLSWFGLEPWTTVDGLVNYSLFIKLSKDSPLRICQKILSFRNIQHYQTRSKSMKIMEQIRARTKVFENFFFPYCIKEWLKLSEEIQNNSRKQFLILLVQKKILYMQYMTYVLNY